uniref:Chromo domain-containing protein n=1 Tax=Panagrolaimus sp. ES5 TaxID=591445 RepID=A0AC34F465_9BILA
MFRARHFHPPIEEEDIEVAKKKLKNILGLAECENNIDDLTPVISDEDEYEADGKEFYVVEKVFKHRIVNGKQEFEVKWLNYGNDENTWEPLECFVSKGSRMEIYLYFIKKWEEKQAAKNQNQTSSDRVVSLVAKKGADNQAGGISKPKHQAVGIGGSSGLISTKEKEGKSSQGVSSADPTNVLAIKKNEKHVVGIEMSSHVAPNKKNEMYGDGIAGSSKVVAKEHFVLKKKKERKEEANENGSSSIPKKKKKLYELDVDCRPKDAAEKMRSGEKRSPPHSHNSFQNVKKLKSSAPLFSRSLNVLKSTMELQRQQAKEYAEQKKKENAKKEKEERLAREEEEKAASDRARMRELMKVLGSSSEEESADEAVDNE